MYDMVDNWFVSKFKRDQILYEFWTKIDSIKIN